MVSAMAVRQVMGVSHPHTFDRRGSASVSRNPGASVFFDDLRCGSGVECCARPVSPGRIETGSKRRDASGT